MSEIDPWENWNGEFGTWTPEMEAKIQAGIAKKKAAPKAKLKAPPAGPKTNDYQRAQAIVDSWPNPLAYHAGEFYELLGIEGWRPCTTAFVRACNKSQGRSAEKSLLPIIAAEVGIPDMSLFPRPTVYWKRVGPRWGGVWEPYELAQHEIFAADGILDLKTGDLRELPDEVIFGPRLTIMHLPYDTEPEETAAVQQENQAFLGFLNSALPDPDILRHFQEVMGSILQPHVSLRGQIVMVGVPHSGKTTLATAIGCAAAGSPGISTAQESEIVRDKWASIMLFGKFANVSDDSGRAQGWVAWMKRYTSGRMTIEPKWHKPTTVVPTAKLISTCNEMQQMPDSSGAAGQRLHVFRFNNPIPQTYAVGQNQYMTSYYWSHPHRRRAVYDWLVEGLRRLHARGHYLPPEPFLSERESAINESDPTRAILADLLTPDAQAFTTSAAIRQAVPPTVTDNMLAQYIRAMFPGASLTREYVSGIRCRGWKGVKQA